MKNKDKINIQAKIINIKTLVFSQSELNINEQNSYENYALDFDTKIKFAYNKTHNEFSVLIAIDINVEQTGELFSTIKVENIYKIESDSELNFENGKNFNVPAIVINSLVETSIGNVRGILVEKFRGTIFQNRILPLMNFTDFTHHADEK